MLEKEFAFYLQHQAELVEKFNGKFLVIIDQEVIGVFDSESTAYFETEKAHEVGTFLIQYCAPGDSAYTQSFHSRVIFV